MALLKMKVEDETYEVDLDKLTLGEARLLKRDYGMADLSQFTFWDPDQMTGLFVIAIRKAHPEMAESDILEKIEGVDVGPILEDLRAQVEAAVEKANAEDPTVAGTASEAATPADEPGPSVTTLTTDGTPS